MIYLSNGSKVKSNTILKERKRVASFFQERRDPESCIYKSGSTRKRADRTSRTRHRVVNE